MSALRFLSLCLRLMTAVFVSAYGPAHAHHPGHAPNMKCHNFVPKVSVKAVNKRVSYTKSKPANNLMHALQVDTGDKIGGDFELKTHLKFSVESTNFVSCVRLEELNVVIYVKPEIEIAQNFSSNSCEHKALTMHENGHVQILRKYARVKAKQIKAEIMKAAQSMRTVSGKRPDSVVPTEKSMLRADALKQIKAIEKKIQSDLSKLQRAHDSAREFKKIASMCS